MSSASRSVTLATAVDPTTAFVVCTSRSSSAQPNRRATCELGSGNPTTSLTVTAGSADSTTVVRWYVAEFAAGVSVQRGVSTFFAGSTTPSSEPAFSAVTLAKSFVILSERTNETDAGTDERWYARARLTGTTTLELSKREGGGTGTTHTVAWQIVQMDGASVQRGTTCIGSSSACPGSNGATSAATLSTPVDTGKSFVLITRRGGTAIGGIDNRLAVRAAFSTSGTSVTGLTFTRAVTSTNSNEQVEIAYEVVSLNDGGAVTRGTAGPSGSSTSSTQLTGNPGAVVAQSVPFFTLSGGSSTQTAQLDDVSWTGVIASSSLIQFDRVGTNVSSAATVAWQAVQFSKCSAVADVANVSGAGTSVNGTARLEYSSSAVLILRKGSAFTANDAPVNGLQYSVGASIGGATVVAVDPSPTTAFEQSGLGSSTTVYYKVFARAGTACYAAGSTSTEVSIRTSGGSTAWVFSNPSGATLNAPVASYGPEGPETALITTTGGKLIAVDLSTGTQRYAPIVTPGGLQTYAIGVTLSGSNEEKFFLGDQSGRVHRIDAVTGEIDWTAGPFSGVNTVRAAITVQHYDSAAWFAGGAAFRTAAFQSPTPTDVVFVASHNGIGTGSNKVLALRADTGALLWTFNTGTTGNNFNMDVIVGQPWIEYETNALYVVARNRSGIANGYWVLDSITGALRGSKLYGNFVNAAVNMSYDPDTMLPRTVYVGNAAGQVHAINVADNSLRWTFNAGSNNVVNGYVSEDWTTGNIFFTTIDGHVWCVDGNGQQVWKTATPVSGVSIPMVLPTDWGEEVAGVYVGSSDGKLRRYGVDGDGLGNASLASSAFVVGDGAVTKALGEPTTFDGTALLIGSDEGKVYKITLPLP